MSKNISSLSKRLGVAGGFFEAQKALTEDGSDHKNLAEHSLMGTAVIEGSRSFYDFMSGDNANKRAYVCNGSACKCFADNDKVRSSLEQQVGPDQVGEMTCLGHCYAGGAFMLDGQTRDITDLDQLERSIADFQPQNLIPQGSSSDESVLLIETTDINEWYADILTACKAGNLDKLLDEMIKAQLRGRGGAGFPAGVKWQSCRDQIADEKYIVCNADEGDPGAFTDRYLLERHPHSVLFGMMLAGVITGAKEGVIYLRAEYPKALEECNSAIEALREANIFAAPLNDSGVSFDVHIVVGAGAYICGEETALLRSIEGQRPVVSVRPPFPVQSGLFAKPTVVNNVETFASCHWILTNGGEAFAALGTEKSAGVKLVSLDHCFNKPGVYEVAMGYPLKQLIEELGGGFKTEVKALHIGGPLGGVVPVSKIDDLNVSFESFSDNGFLLGHASIIGIPENVSMLDYLKHLFEFTAHESCGKCFPCRLGATRGKEMLQDATAGEPLDKALLEDLLETMELGSLCALGGGVPLPAKNILRYFTDELFQANNQELSHD